MKITLPPLPVSIQLHDGVPTHWLSSEFLRARDLEVARVVLEAAAKACEYVNYTTGECPELATYCADAIRALEVSHD